MTAARCLSFCALRPGGNVALYGILRLQRFLPWFFSEFHDGLTRLSFNTAVGFSTTTTWQAYGGESTMTYVNQMVGLCAQNFLAAAAGLAVGVAFIRGFARAFRRWATSGWTSRGAAVDSAAGRGDRRGLLVWQGVPMNVLPYTGRRTDRFGPSGHRAGAGCGARIIRIWYQRRRLLQRKRCAPVREPDASRELFELLALSFCRPRSRMRSDG